MMPSAPSLPPSRSASEGSLSAKSVVLNTPHDETLALPHAASHKDARDDDRTTKEHEELLSPSGFQMHGLPEIGYQELSQPPRRRQLPPHQFPAATTLGLASKSQPLRDTNTSLVVKFKRLSRVFWAEFFGTAILALFGTAVNNQVALSNSTLVTNSPAGSYISVAFGWALAVMLGVYVSAGISGGHVNPAITLALAIFRDFPWHQVPVYWFAQITGAVSGAGLVYWNYSHAIDLFEGGNGARTIAKTGSLFFTNPLPYVSNFNCFYNEFLMTSILMIFVVAVGDEGNTAPPKYLGPFVIFWVVFGLASTLGMQTSFALNPARDLGPRILTWLAGYGGAVWTVRDHYWFSVAILGPVCGAIVGCFVYDFFIATERVSGCVLHKPTDMSSVMRKLRDITPLKDPEQTNLTRFDRRKPRRDYPVGRLAHPIDDNHSVGGSARTTSHRYTSLTR